MIRNAAAGSTSRFRPHRDGGRAAACLAAMLLASSAVARTASAQAGPRARHGPGRVDAARDDNGAPAPAPAAPAATTAAQSLGPYGYGNPQAPNGTIGGGNATESSAHPVTGDQEDSFDLGESARGAPGAAHGGQNGPIFAGPTHLLRRGAPDTHTVRRGDTLWDICDFYFQNPTSGRASGPTTRRSRTRTGFIRETRCI